MIAPRTPRRIALYVAFSTLTILCTGTLLLSGCGDDSPTSPGNGGDTPDGWTVLYPTPQPNDILAAARSTSNTLLAAGRAGTILRSTDNGATWDLRRAESAHPDLLAIDIANSFAVAVGVDGTVIRSTNAGRDWEPMDLGAPDAVFVDVDVADDSTAYVIDFFGSVWSTTDAGLTWTENDLGMHEPQSVSFYDRDEGMICAYEGWYWTEDGGANWVDRDRQNSMYPRAVQMTGPLSAVTVLQSVSPTELVVFTTDDSGLSWTERLRQSAYGYESLSVFADTVCYALLSGHIEHSTDAGQTWTELREIDWTNDVILATGEASFAVFGPGGYCATSDDNGVTLTEHRQTAGDLDSPGTIGTLQFLDESTGFAGFYADGLLRTDDGGGTWTPVVEDHYVIDFHFLDADTAMALLRENSVSSDANDLRRTTDGGQTWTTLFTDNLTGLHLLPGGTGLVTRADGGIIHTADGGVTWDPPALTPDAGSARQPFCVNADTMIVLGQQNSIYRTMNAGATWYAMNLGSHMRAVDFNADRSLGIGVGWNVIGAGRIFRTLDGGATWLQYPIDCPSLLAVDFADDLTACAVGDEGVIMTTTDGGLTWAREECISGQRLECVDVLPDGRAWAAGSYGTIVGLEQGAQRRFR